MNMLCFDFERASTFNIVFSYIEDQQHIKTLYKMNIGIIRRTYLLAYVYHV